ncbi:aldose 1-epimerase family protein [Lactococcus ileimucosae]|uniref:aldose 1-epimerase family protein n=1 Tax=Lactococcus ileimucosae TaxID=2941329 RepID=UPI00204332DF|nr:aldose 1-epimerase family protein [Lactococcus ileimucosae]
MKHTLKNGTLTVEVSAFGAELNSVKKEGIEYLWQADADFWGRHAPVLFPIVGKLKNGQYIYEDRVYDMSGHGFARDSVFTLVKEEEDELIYELVSSVETLASYPFEFSFRVGYKLMDNRIRVRYQVENKDHKRMIFGVGAHPAFNVPLEKGTFEDYTLTVSPSEKRTFIPLDLPTGMLKREEQSEVEVSELPLKHELFAKDALVYTSSNEMSVALTNSLDKRSVKVTWKDMPFFGLWSPYPTEASFVCIEPWAGIADELGTSGQLTEKFGMNQLNPQEEFSCSYIVEIN